MIPLEHTPTLINRTPRPSLEGNEYYRSDLPRLNPDAKDPWVKALVSDKYKDKQGKNMLKTPTGSLCCLGVYCEVAGIPEHKEAGNYRDEASDEMMFTQDMPTFGSGDSKSSVLIPPGYTIEFVEPKDPATCTPWWHFNGEEAIFICQEQGPINDVTGESATIEHLRGNKSYSLPMLNDSGEFTFAQIADIIRYFL